MKSPTDFEMRCAAVVGVGTRVAFCGGEERVVRVIDRKEQRVQFEDERGTWYALTPMLLEGVKR